MAPAMNPRTVCFCHPIWSMISARVAPFFRWSIATTWAVLLPSRGGALFCACAAFARLAGPLAELNFLDLVAAAAIGLPPGADFWLCGVPFFGRVVFFAGAFCGA